jgi:hypothetical protein
MTTTFAEARNIETVVHAVYEKYVGVARIAKECACALCQSSSRVACEVAWPTIGLSFDDACDSPSRGKVVDHVTAEERTCDDQRVARIPCTRKAVGDVEARPLGTKVTGVRFSH